MEMRNKKASEKQKKNSVNKVQQRPKMSTTCKEFLQHLHDNEDKL